jgi:hypothetical protein
VRRPEGLGRIAEDMSCRAFVVVAFVKEFRLSAGQLCAKFSSEVTVAL